MPRQQPEYVDATFYAVIVPEFSAATDAQGRPILTGAKLDKTTQNRPGTMPRSGGIVTRLTLRVDADALLPLLPDAVIHVRAGEVETIHAVAEDPRDQDPDSDEETTR